MIAIAQVGAGGRRRTLVDRIRSRLQIETAPRFDRPNMGSRRLNAGDKVLTEVFNHFILNGLAADSAPYIDCHRYFDDAHIELLNSTDGVVVGGGGLFLYDTYPTGNGALHPTSWES
jgi:hypothetical protein